MTATILFCDITDTIEGKIKNTITDYKNFNNLANSIKTKNNSDYLFISLISSDNETIVKQNLNNLLAYCDNNKLLCKHFFDNGYFDGKNTVTGISGKCSQMLYYLSELSQKYSIDNIILADDFEFTHEMFEEISSEYGWKDKFCSIIPTEKKGLQELNKLLKLQILDKKEKKLIKN